MIKSMTGYGRAQQVLDGRDVTVELRSVNHRYFEFSARVPRNFGYLEEKLKSFLQGQISRGKLEISVQLSVLDGGSSTVEVNKELAGAYVAALREMCVEFGLQDDLSASAMVRFPDLFTVRKPPEDEEVIWEQVRTVAVQAVERFVEMRRAEGARLREDILKHLDDVEKRLAVVRAQSPRTVEAYRERLEAKMREILADRQIDEGRLLTEAALFADRVAVDEETVRLASHIAQFREVLVRDEAVGRKLDFLVQEMNREANTIGSKAQDVEIAQAVVEIKSDIEKIREQIQNIE